MNFKALMKAALKGETPDPIPFAPRIDLWYAALLTTTMPEMKKVVDTLVEAGVRERVKVIIGGAPVTPEYARQIGADGYAANAREAALRIQQMLR
jgi:methanogenic corrinoid protein MtbC1